MTSKSAPNDSILVLETPMMENERRVLEKNGHRQFARVHAKAHDIQQHSENNDPALGSGLQQNPWLLSQRFDGTAPDENPAPPLNSDARREFDNQRREQEMEKQLRLGYNPNKAPKPEGPR